MTEHNLSDIDQRINERGFFERLLSEQNKRFEGLATERDKREDERDKRINERFLAAKEAVAIALAERDKSVAAAFATAEKAVLKAEQANDKKFDNANEWRGQSADRERTQQEQITKFTATLLPRETFEAFEKSYIERHQALVAFQSRILGALAVVTFVIPITSGIIFFVLSH